MIFVSIAQPSGDIRFGFNRDLDALNFVQTCLETSDDPDETIITITQKEEN